MKSWVSWSCGLTFAMSAMTPGLVAQQPGNDLPERISWMAAHAIPIRSVNSYDHDYSDLQPLHRAIGSARIVLLGGSPLTGSEGEVKGKYRLLRFLHEEMGFDTLACPVALFDGEKLDSGTAPKSMQVSISRDIFGYRSMFGRVMPSDVMDYITATRKSSHPLHFAGIGADISLAPDLYVTELFRFLDGIDPAIARPEDRETIRALVRSIQAGGYENRHSTSVAGSVNPNGPLSHQWETTVRPGLETLARFDGALRSLSPNRADASDVSRYSVTLKDLGWYAASLAGRRLAQIPPDSLVELAQVWRPESKIVVWSNNFSIMREEPTPDGTGPSTIPTEGSVMGKKFGDAAYSIAFVEIHGGYDPISLTGDGPVLVVGEYGRQLEYLIHEFGKHYCFLDLRSIPQSHWMRQAVSSTTMHGSKFSWPQRYDAVVGIDPSNWKH